MQTRSWICCVVLTAGFTAACEQDSQRAPWENGSSDAEVDANTDTDAGVEDGGNPDTPTGDAGDVYDPNWGWDVELPPEMSKAPAVPDQPPAESHCNSGSWCWIHPTPFPHRIRNLRRAGDAIHAVADGRTIQLFEAMVWDGDGFDIAPTPSEAYTLLTGLFPTQTGWLGVTRSGRVVHFGLSGLRRAWGLRGDEYRKISGSSSRSFVAVRDDGGGVIVRDGTPRRFERLPGYPMHYRMWQDGTVWSTAPDDEAPTTDQLSRLFPIPPGGDRHKTRALGPDPTSRCADEGIWTTSGEDALYKWSESDERWRSTSYRGPLVTSLSCGPGGDVIATDERGGLSWREDGTWTRAQVSRWALLDAVTVDRTLYVSGVSGELLRVTEDDIERTDKGFRPPTADTEGESNRGYWEMWADGSEIVLLHSDGVYHGDTDGWSRMPFVMGDDTGVSPRADVWGLDEPTFLVNRDGMHEWDGSTWRPVDAHLGDDVDLGLRKKIVGVSNDNVWAKARNNLSRYDGTDWSLVTGNNSAIGQRIQQENLDIGTLHARDNGDIILTASGDIYDIVGGPGQWALERRSTTPCASIVDVYFADDGSLYVIGTEQTLARKADDHWTTFEFPSWTNVPGITYSRNSGYRGLFEHPKKSSPIVASFVGAFSIDFRGTDADLEPLMFGSVFDGRYLPDANAVFLLQERGLAAKYF